MTPTPFRVPLHCLVIKPNIPAGMNIETIVSKIKLYRTTAEDEEPTLVRLEFIRTDGRFYRILDGRHRFFSAVIAGRVDLLCMEECDE
jgi:hypothetical protein